MLRRALIGLGMLAATTLPGFAQSAVDLLQKHLYAGQTAEADRALSALPVTDKTAQAALGMARFVAAFERLGQGLHRYGAQAPRTMFMPFLAFPVPPNLTPEKITYQAFRDLLATLVRDLDAAQKTLEAVGDAPVKIPVDVFKLRIDVDADGVARDNERFVDMFIRTASGAPTGGAPLDVGSFPIHFDTADMYWLRGYCNLIATFAEFFLAHDFRETFEQTFHVFFPAADLPFARISGEGKVRDRREFGDYSVIGDAVALIHLIRWKTVEPARLAGIKTRLKAVVDLNRKTWASARAETDNDREWLPNPRQQGVLTGVPVTEELLASWLSVIDQLEKMLDGKLLIPHWRFEKGVNLGKFLTESKEFDLVLWVTGHGVLPYLEAGPMIDSGTWSQVTRGLNGNFLRYAFYFN